MDFFKDMFPFIKLPTFSDTSFVDAFCGCMTCHPFGTLKRNTSMSHLKPTSQVSTISAIMEKIRAGGQNGRIVGNGTATLQSNCSNTFKIRKSFCGKPCTRKTSFTNDMNHEKFTPVNYSSEFHKRDLNANSLSTTPDHQEYYKIEFRSESIANVIKQGDMENPVVPPPRRKRKSGLRKLSDCTNIEEISVLSLGREANREEWKNSRNIELNDLDQTKYINCDKIQENNINIHDKIIYNNNNNNNNNINNNNNNNNKKSGCSNIEVVSDSIEPNQIMHSRKLSSVNNINKLTNYDDNSMEYCENKVYYKNSGFDKYGNYKHGSEIDEVIVCESIVVTLERARSEETIPDNSTYTKFYTDSLYYDKSDGNISSSSSEAPFEHIKRLKSENNLILRSPFSRLKAKRSSMRAKELKNNKRTRHESLIKDFYGLLPIHQLSGSFSSINPLATLTRKPNIKSTVSRGKYPTLEQNPGNISNLGARKQLKKQNSVGESFDSDYQYSSTDRCDL